MDPKNGTDLSDKVQETGGTPTRDSCLLNPAT